MAKMKLKDRLVKFFNKKESKPSKADSKFESNVKDINIEAPGRNFQPPTPPLTSPRLPLANGHKIPNAFSSAPQESQQQNGIEAVAQDSPGRKSPTRNSIEHRTEAGRASFTQSRVQPQQDGNEDTLVRSSIGSQRSGSATEAREEHHANGSPNQTPNGQSRAVSEAELEDIVASLRDGDVDCRSAAAERLFNKAAVDESARLRTTSMGVVQPLVRLLYDGKERGRMYAAYALSSIMTPSQPLTEMRAAGVIPALIAVLNTAKHLASKKGAMRALGRLARLNEPAAEIVHANGLPPMIALLDCEDLGLVRRCLVALYFIGADKEDLQSAMAQMGVTAPVVRLCRHDHPDIQAEATDVVKVLARHPRAAAVIVECGGLDTLAMIADRGKSDRAKASAMKAIQRLVAAPALEQRVRASPAGAFIIQEEEPQPECNVELGKLADLMTQGPQHERTEATKEVGHALEADPTVTSVLAAGGIVPSLVAMLNDGEVQGQVYAASSLTKMAADPVVQDQIVAAGAIPHLVAIMRDNIGAAPTAAGAIECLAGHPKYAAAIIRHRGVLALVGLLNAGTREAFLPTMRALKELSGLDPDVSQLIVKAEGIAPLVRRSAKGSADVRIASLSVLRDVAKHGHSLIESGGVAVLAALEHSNIIEVSNLSTSTLSLQAIISPQCAQAVAYERGMQMKIGHLVSELKTIRTASNSTIMSVALEEAMRMVPRPAFLPLEKAHDGFDNKSVRVHEADLQLSSPAIDALALYHLNPEVGHSFLDVGSGSGYLTMLASHMVAYSGTAVGVDIRELVVEYAEAKVSDVKLRRGLADLSITFLRGSIFGHPSLPVMGRFNRIYVGANCPKLRLKDLLRLLKPGGKMAVACDGNLLLLTQPTDGPVEEPCILGQIPRTEVLFDDGPDQESSGLPTGPSRQEPHRDYPTDTKIFTSPHEAAQREMWRKSQQKSGPKQEQAKLPPGAEKESEPVPKNPWNDQGDRFPGPPEEEQHGWFISRDDIRICHNAEGKKCKLGEGGFGVVYKALMNGVDEVAVKLVKADKPTQKEMSLFHKEVRVLRKLHHKNIVQFYGANLEPGSMFFVTELMKGGDLYSALRHHPETMRWDRLGKKVAHDTALGINYLHTRKPPMMHRDLKSPNVLLSEEGVAKIADVGMVRAQVKDLVTAQPVMTPLWAAPEVIRHERASVKADMWSYGILIWELVSGQDITEMQPLAIARQMHGPQRGKTLELPPNCPGIAKFLFERCTQMDPENRPTASKVVEWLRHPGI